MVNHKSWATVIFVLNSHISCQTLLHSKHSKERKTKTRCLSIMLVQMHVSFVSRVVSKHAR